MNFKFINITLFLNLVLILTNTKASIAANFFVTPEETIIREESFSTPLKAERNRFIFQVNNQEIELL